MVIWRKELDPFITIHPVKSTSFLPMIYNPPDLPLSIQLAIYLPTSGRESDFLEAIAELDVCIAELAEKYLAAVVFLHGDFNVSKSNSIRSGVLNFLCANHDFQSVDIISTA